MKNLCLALLSWVAVVHVGCTLTSHRSPRTSQVPARSGGPNFPANPRYVESYGPVAPQQQGSLPLYLPGNLSQQMVNFQVLHGMAIYEGDIVLGPVNSLLMRYGMPKLANPNVKSAVAVSNQSYLWSNGVIPFVIDHTVSEEKREHIAWAIAMVNETELKMPPRTTERNYVNFNGAGSGCTSYLGQIGGPQEIQVEGCGRGSVIHEILHAAGFYHEQSRADRDNYVTVAFDEIEPSYRQWFEKTGSRSQDIGGYDYDSIMHYSTHAFSRRGMATIIPKDPNAQIGQRDGLSPLDRAAITHLYGAGSQPGFQPPGPQPPATQPPSGSFAGSYTSNRGDVACAQNGGTVTCRYPEGTMICAAGGSTLDCGWSGGGQGRATFARQPDGAVAGTYGDFLSNTSRGRWDLVPAGGGTGQPPGPGTSPPGPGTGTPPGPGTGGPTSLSGAYTSTRGPMNCTESGTTVICTFQEGSTAGRLSCSKDQTGLNLNCNWATFFPVPGMGQAVLSRKTTSDRILTGTWGSFNSSTNGGQWDAQGQ